MAKTFRAFMDAYFTAEDLEDALGQLAEHFRACQEQVASGSDDEGDEAPTDVFMAPSQFHLGPAEDIDRWGALGQFRWETRDSPVD